MLKRWVSKMVSKILVSNVWVCSCSFFLISNRFLSRGCGSSLANLASTWSSWESSTVLLDWTCCWDSKPETAGVLRFFQQAIFSLKWQSLRSWLIGCTIMVDFFLLCHFTGMMKDWPSPAVKHCCGCIGCLGSTIRSWGEINYNVRSTIIQSNT